MTTLRHSTLKDLPGILEIIAQAQAYLAAQGVDQWQDGYPNEATMREDIRLERSYVLEADGGILGIASLVFDGEPTYDVICEGAWLAPEPYACIHRIAMDAAARGSGAAGELMALAEAETVSRGMYSVRIDTHRDNLVMQRMLQKNGYTRCGIIYLGAGGDGRAPGAERIAFEKVLAAPAR